MTLELVPTVEPREVRGHAEELGDALARERELRLLEGPAVESGRANVHVCTGKCECVALARRQGHLRRMRSGSQVSAIIATSRFMAMIGMIRM